MYKALLTSTLFVGLTTSRLLIRQQDPDTIRDAQDGCVDISRFGPLDFDDNLVEMCSYRTITRCTKRMKENCVEVPVHDCEIKSHVNCDNIPVTETVANDIAEIGEFAQQICQPGPKVGDIFEIS